MRSVALSEAKDHLSEFVTAAAGGEEIVITRHGKPAAKLIAITDQEMIEARGRAAWEKLSKLRENLRAQGIRVTKEEWVAWKNEGRV